MNEYKEKVLAIADELTREFKFKWNGIDSIAFIYHGEWSDAEIIYKGITLNECEIDDFMWNEFNEEFPQAANNGDYKKYAKYLRANKERIEDYIIYEHEWNIKDIEAFILDNCTFKKNGRQIERFIKNHLSEKEINDIIKAYNLQETDELTESLQDFLEDYDYDFEDECFLVSDREIEEFLTSDEEAA